MSEKNLGGRPSKFTPERRQAIIDAVSKAIPYEYAAEANGISEGRLYEWLLQGKRDRESGIDSDFSQFHEDLKKAEAERINRHLKKIDDGNDKWVCDAWILERRWWKHYSKSAPILDFEQRLKKMEEGSSNGKAKEMDSESDQK